jgi:hypothetical protein
MRAVIGLLVLLTMNCSNCVAIPAPEQPQSLYEGLQKSGEGGLKSMLAAVGRSGRRLLQFASRIQGFDMYERNMNTNPIDESNEETAHNYEEANDQYKSRGIVDIVDLSTRSSGENTEGSTRSDTPTTFGGEGVDPESPNSGGDLPETNNGDLDQLHEPANEPEVKIGTLVPQETLPQVNSGGEFKGIDGGIVDHANITHLSYMVFKLIKKHQISSVVDIPCRNSLSWFPAMLHRLDYEIMNFKYYCVDTETKSQEDIQHLFGDAGSPEIIHLQPGESNKLPKTDLVFSWNGPQQWGVGRTWSFFNGIRDVRPKYLMFTNNPGATNDGSGRGILNVRKQPFHVSPCNSNRFLLPSVF